MGTLLTKPLSEITFGDVTSFCDPVIGTPENQTLEYKGGGNVPSPKGIAKAASALANTFGGTLILGVNEDQQYGRPANIPGVPAGRNLENRISDILLDNITPPLVPMPEIQVVEFPNDSGRAVVVIRVAQSNATPHAVKNNNGDPCIYVRAGSESRPVKDWDTPATPERLEWLFGRRKKSEEFHDRLLQHALDRTELYYERGTFPSFGGDVRPHGQGIFWILPLYPEGQVATVQELYDKCRGSMTRDDQKLQVVSQWDCTDFPSYTLMPPRSIQDGIVGFSEYDGPAVRSFEFNTFGLFLCQQTFATRPSEDSKTLWKLPFLAMLRQLDSYLQLASRFYDTIKPVGLLQLHVRLINLDGVCMVPGYQYYERKGFVSYQRRIDCERVVQANEFHDSEQRDRMLLGLLCEIGNAFNWKQTLVGQLFDRERGRNPQTTNLSS